MSDFTTWVLIILGIAVIVSFLIAMRYLKRNMDESGPVTARPSTILFGLSGLALFSVWAKPAQWQVGNYIILGIIAALVVMAIRARWQGR